MGLAIAAGTRIKHYKIVSRLGAGGMGEVYLAEDTRLLRSVAIKLIAADFTSDERAKGRLLREARAAATLDHPNICAIYEIGEDAGRNFIVLQYIEGKTLAEKIKAGLNLQSALEIATQIAEALGVAHHQGILHRDIKPENIMITERNQVKVLDFGLAKIMQRGDVAHSDIETASDLTATGVVLGTVPYMSPEQLRGEELDPRSDIFSFGVVLYEMLSGKRPFQAKSKAEIISAILTQEPPPLDQAPVQRSTGLAQLVQKCMQKDPSRRYQSMADLILDIERLRSEPGRGPGNATSQADKAGTGHRRPGFSARAWLLLAAAVGLAVSIYALFYHPSPKPLPTSKILQSPAYDDYVRGKVKVSSENREDNDGAIRLLKKATEADPDYAPAYAELARAYTIKVFYFASSSEMKQLTEDAEVAVQKALDLDPNLAEAHLARGLILWTHAKGFPHELAIQSYKRALTLNPNLEEAHHQLGVVYYHIGLLDRARGEIDKALAINPNNTLARFRLGSISLLAGNYDEALRIIKSIPQDANPAIRERVLATIFFQLGRTNEATQVVEDFLKNDSMDEGGGMTSVKAMLLAKSGNQAAAEEAIRHSIEIGKDFGHFHHTSYNIASAYALMNRPGEAMKWLQVTADDGFPCYPLFENDPNLASLRKNPQFLSFMAKLKQQWEEYKATL